MHQLGNWRRFIRGILATTIAAVLLLITPAFTGVAQADDQSLMSAAKDFSETIDNSRTVFDDFSRDSQRFLGGTQISGELNGALSLEQD